MVGFAVGFSPAIETLFVLIVLTLFVGTGILARRNLRRGYGDSQGARRLGMTVASGVVIFSLLGAHHVPVPSEQLSLFFVTTGLGLLWAGFSWLAYMSFEPYLRRSWSNTLIGWTRLVSGRVRDPLVGRDVLVGLVAGVVVVAMAIVRYQVGRRFGLSFRMLDYSSHPILISLRSERHFIAMLVFLALDAVQFALGSAALLLLVQIAVHNRWVSAAILLVCSIALNSGGVSLMWGLAYAVPFAVIAVITLVRFGLLSLAAMLLITRLLTRLPITLGVHAWYFGLSLATLFGIAGLAIYGFKVALGGRPAFGETAA